MKNQTIFETKPGLLRVSIGRFSHTELIVAIKMLIRKKYLETRNLQEQVTVRKKSYS